MVFHQLSLSGAWLTKNIRQIITWPSADAISGETTTAAVNINFFKIEFIFSLPGIMSAALEHAGAAL